MNPYRVEFEHAGRSHDWFYTRVYYNNALIATKSVCKSYWRASWWAKRRIKDHRRGFENLWRGV